MNVSSISVCEYSCFEMEQDKLLIKQCKCMRIRMLQTRLCFGLVYEDKFIDRCKPSKYTIAEQTNWLINVSSISVCEYNCVEIEHDKFLIKQCKCMRIRMLQARLCFGPGYKDTCIDRCKQSECIRIQMCINDWASDKCRRKTLSKLSHEIESGIS